MNEHILNELKKNFTYTWYSISDEQKNEVANYLTESIDKLIELNKKIMNCVELNLKRVKELCGSEQVYNNVVDYCNSKIKNNPKLIEYRRFYDEEIKKISGGEYLSSTKMILFNTVEIFMKDDRDLTKLCNYLVDCIYRESNDILKKEKILKATEYLLEMKYLDKENLCESYKTQIENVFSKELSYDGPVYLA